MSLLSLLVVTRGEAHTPRFFTHFRAVADMLGIPWVLALDRCEPPDLPKPDGILRVECQAVIEEVLVDVHRACRTPWVLRLDDDETLSTTALPWLTAWMLNPPADIWGFAIPRANLWGSETLRLAEPDMFPDRQGRLMRRECETRTEIHAGLNAHAVVPWMILHHKFLVKSRAERETIAMRYESVCEGRGLGDHFIRYSVPEAVFGDNPATAPLYIPTSST